MSKEIIKGILAIIVVAGAVASVFITTTANAQDILVPLAGFAMGYYFKQVEIPVITRARSMFNNKK